MIYRLGLSLFYSHIFTGNIWKIYEDIIDGLLVIETRDYDSRSVTFSIFDVRKGAFLWKDITMKETWWIGIEDAYGGRIFFHHFHNLQFSNHLGIICVGALSGQVLWERPDLVFNKLLPDRIIATTNSDVPEYTVIDIHKGQPVAGRTSLTDNQLQVSEFEKQRRISVHTADIFHEEENNFNLVNKFLWNTNNVIAVKMMEYLEFENYVFVSYYIHTDNGLSNYLLIIDNKGIVLSNILLCLQLKGVGTATFFIFERKLIFVKEKRELCIYEL